MGLLLLPEEIKPLTLNLFVGALSIVFIVFGILYMILYIVLLHFAVGIVGGKGKLNDTLKVVCYSFSPLNFAWVFASGMMLMYSFKNLMVLFIVLPLMLAYLASFLYIYYIEVVGLSVTSGITKLRAFAAVMIQLVLTIIVIVLSLNLLFLSMYSYNDSSATSNDYVKNVPDTLTYEKYSTTVYSGTTPQIDGTINDYDNWFEGDAVNVRIKGRPYSFITFITKHDSESLYILLEWDGHPEWKDEMAIYFEQDEGSPDHNLSNGRVDNYYPSRDGAGNLLDAHYSSGEGSLSGYNVIENQNGAISGAYSEREWRYKLEWKIPLRSGDPYDIYIDEYPKTVGFSIVNLKSGKGVWPPDASPHKPETWGKMMFVEKRLYDK